MANSTNLCIQKKCVKRASKNVFYKHVKIAIIFGSITIIQTYLKLNHVKISMNANMNIVINYIVLITLSITKLKQRPQDFRNFLGLTLIRSKLSIATKNVTKLIISRST